MALMASPLSAIFFGSSDFSVPVLRVLLDSGYDVRAVYTQPDRPAGRGRTLHASPVATAARNLGLRLEQPEKIREDSVLGTLRAYASDVVVLAAYGLLIPRPALEIPPLGWINVHPSLLPRYRGASPVVAPILAGDEETGVSLFKMGVGLDDGPVLAQEKVAIGRHETAGELTSRLAQVGARMLPPTLAAMAEGRAVEQEQEHDRASYAPRLSKESALLDWSKPAELLEREVRAYNPWPVSHTFWNERQLRVLRAERLKNERHLGIGEVGVQDASGLPLVGCGEGALLLREVQLAGGKPMAAKTFLLGRPDLRGAVLGPQRLIEPSNDS